MPRSHPQVQPLVKRGTGFKNMMIAQRLRAIREGKNLSQKDVEQRSGLLRVYVSRVENGHTVPNLETLEKLARALEVPLYHLFYEGEEPPVLKAAAKRRTSKDALWGASGRDAQRLSMFCRYLSLMDERGRNLLLFVAHRIATRKHSRS